MAEEKIFKITKIIAEEIEDSRGNPTLKVSVYSGDLSGSFSVPSGASTGVHEAHELRDPEPERALNGASENGKGVKDAVFKVNNLIAGALVGKNVLNQKEIDRIMIELDGTQNKDNLGGNSMIGVSIACAKLAAKVSGIEVFEYLRTLRLNSGQALNEIKPSRKIPFLFINLINGGKHARNNLAFQEYHIVPDVENIPEAISVGINIQNSLRNIIKRDFGEDSIILGDEGGFAPQINDIKKPLQLLNEAIKENKLEGKVRLALDVAASSFFENGKYKIADKEISKENLMDIYNHLIKEFDLISIEDPFNEEDFESFRKLIENNENFIVVGDDLTVTNKMRLKEALEKKSVNAMIIKPNQIGTLSETLETMKLARDNDVDLIISHRSGETDDNFIADLAYAFGCFGLKSGSPIKPERMVKYQRLIEIAK
ncbi:enolase [Patescibacteria group bacterium]|nr:enolase [Patescibacteria group bacterium]MBU1728205.1 enolase [Patescibacteria group bacterium]